MISAGRDDWRAPARVPRGEWLKRRAKWLIILPPLLFLVVFFLIPFGFALSISFADTAIRVPPFTDILSVSPDSHIHLTLNLGNFKYLFTDEVYGLSYLYSPRWRSWIIPCWGGRRIWAARRGAPLSK